MRARPPASPRSRGILPQQALAHALGASREEINRRRKALLDTGYQSKGEDGEYLDAMTPMPLAPFGF